MSRFEIDRGSVQFANGRKERPCWLVLERGEPVMTAWKEEHCRNWVKARRDEIVKACDHPSMKASVEGPDMTLTAECLDCETVFEADLRDVTLTEIGRQP